MSSSTLSSGFTHQFTVVSSGSQVDLSERECLPKAGAPALFLQITEPGQATPSACTKLSPKTVSKAKAAKPDAEGKPFSSHVSPHVPPHVAPTFDTSAIDMMISPKSRRPVKHPAGSNDAHVHTSSGALGVSVGSSVLSSSTSPSNSTSTNPVASAERGPNTRMKLSQLLRTASQQSAPGQPGENPFANLLLLAAKALDAHPDSALLDFLEDQCSVNIKCGSTSIVNPLDLRRAVTLLRADHLTLMGNHSDTSSAGAGRVDASLDTPNSTPGAVHSAPGNRMAA